MASSAMGLNLGVFGDFADHTCKSLRKANALMIFARHTVFYACLSSRAYPQYMQVTQALNDPRLFWSGEKPEDLQIEPHAGIKMAEGLVSLLYICGVYPSISINAFIYIVGGGGGLE